jgi:hypothetical protein
MICFDSPSFSVFPLAFAWFCMKIFLVLLEFP